MSGAAEGESLDSLARRKRRPRRSVTVATVAKAAGVSRAAVSFAYNAPGQLSVDTRARILAMAESLGYAPDPIARMLTTRRVGAIGLLMVEPIEAAFANPFTSAFVRGMGHMCDLHGMALTLLPPRMGSISDTVQSAVVDGVVTLGLASDHPSMSALLQRNLPLVIVDSAPSAHWSSIRIDDEGGAFAAASHLFALGHRHFAVLSFELQPINPRAAGHQQFYVPSQRLRGYRRALDKSGELVTLDIYPTHSDSAEGMHAMRRILGRPGPHPTAILAMSDAIALGAIRACEEAKLQVPRDISVVGFDDVPEAASVGLTTVAQPIEDKGRMAVQMLLREIAEDPPITYSHEQLDTRLVVRRSTGPVDVD